VRMVTISCSCGAASTTRRNPLRGLTLDERTALIRSAFSVHAGFLAVEVDGSWHPAHVDPTEACFVLADLDAIDATDGLTGDDARRVRDLLDQSHVGGRALPVEAQVGSVRFRVTPADDFMGRLTYLVHDGAATLLEVAVPREEPHVLADLVDLFRTHGAAAVVQADGLAPRIGLGAAIEGVRRARTASVA
jgi:hypothetical protein